MIALVFLYLIATIFVYGGELNAEIIKERERRHAAEEAARRAAAARAARAQAPMFQKMMRRLGYEKTNAAGPLVPAKAGPRSAKLDARFRGHERRATPAPKTRRRPGSRCR